MLLAWGSCSHGIGSCSVCKGFSGYSDVCSLGFGVGGLKKLLKRREANLYHMHTSIEYSLT